MEEQNRENRLQFLPQPLNWMAHNASGLYIDRDANQHYTMTPGVNGIYPEIVPVPQWVHPPQIPQNYVEFLAERGYPEISKQVPYDITKQVPSSRLVDPPQLEEYPRPHNERNFVTAFTGSEHQPGIQKQNRKNEESSNAFQAYSGSGAASSKGTSEARQKRSREKAIAADRVCNKPSIASKVENITWAGCITGLGTSLEGDKIERGWQNGFAGWCH
ncbi:hypothetical protein ACP275_04G027100 [Erythranthe tilingii]